MESEKDMEFEDFDQLKAYYSNNLPLSIDSIFEKLLGKPATILDIKGLTKIRNDIHKLAGSAGSFGFLEISTSLKKLDVYFAEFIENNHSLDNLDYDYLEKSMLEIKKLFNGKMTAASEDKNHTVTALPAVHGRLFEKIPDSWNKKMILCNSDNKKYLEDLSSKLKYFGYAVNYFTEIDKALSFMQSETIYLVLMDIDSLNGEPGIGSQLVRQKEITKSMKIMYTSDQNDFQMRLFALRNGGDAFFEFPINIIKMVDKIEYFADSRRTKPDHVLIIDDDMDTLSYYAHLFQQNGMITSVTTDPSSVFDLIIEAEPDLVLIDLLMPGCNGIELASVIRQHEEFVSIPIILYSAFDKPPVIDLRMPLSGDEFINKSIDDETLLGIAMNRINRSRSLRHFMERDSLTGLLNHTNLNDSFYRELLRADRMGLPLSYAMIDIDNFKSVNDKYGHLVGDTILKSLAYMLMERLRSTDIVGRYGGEEFVVILSNTSVENAKKVIDGIRNNFSKVPHNAMGQEFFITFSCGVAGYPGFSLAETISDAADKALYQAKHAGKNRIIIYGQE